MNLIEMIQSREAKVAVIGMGYAATPHSSLLTPHAFMNDLSKKYVIGHQAEKTFADLI